MPLIWMGNPTMRPDSRTPLMLASALLLLTAVSATPAMAGQGTSDSVWTPDVWPLGFGTPSPGLPNPTAPQPPPQTRVVEKDGAASYQRSGDHTFTVPEYTVITFQVNGGGGSAARPVTPISENPTRYAPDFGTPGNDGSNSALPALGMVGGGGGFGNGVTAIYRGGCFPRCTVPYPYSTIGNDSVTMTFYPGNDGGASGGDVNTVGGAENGGKATEAGGRNGGGHGGRTIRTFTKGQAGAPVPGQSLALRVGAGGEPAVVTEPMRINGIRTEPGGEGSVFINWKYLSYE